MVKELQEGEKYLVDLCTKLNARVSKPSQFLLTSADYIRKVIQRFFPSSPHMLKVFTNGLLIGGKKMLCNDDITR